MIYVLCNINQTANDLLPHFLRHYTDLKVDAFVFGIRNGKENPVWNDVERICKHHGVKYFITSSYFGELNGGKESLALDELRKTYVNPPNWYVPTDLDEFHLLPVSSYPELIDLCNCQHVESAVNILIDRVREDLTIPLTIDPHIPITEQFPRELDITKSILQAFNEKIILARYDIAIWPGHHNSPAKCLFPYGKTLHFKWFGDLWKKEEEKFQLYKKQGHCYHIENKRLLCHLKTHNGKLG